jgi:hypothetical protein
VTGWIADRIGLQAALGLTALALVAALALCWSIPATALRRPALAPVGSRS